MPLSVALGTMMRSTLATASTANVGSVRLSAEEARLSMQAGSGVATLSKKLATRRSEDVVGLTDAGRRWHRQAGARSLVVCSRPHVMGARGWISVYG